jgi:hypothetical protein
VDGIHERAQVVKTVAHARQGDELESREEKADAHEQLQEQAEIVEQMLPACLGVPGGMRLKREEGRWSRMCAAERSKDRTLQAHQQRGAHDHFPPARDALGVGEAVVGPAHFIFDLPEAVLNGLITNDKFCLSRHIRLRLTWSRYPLRLRLLTQASGRYLPGGSAQVRSSGRGL